MYISDIKCYPVWVGIRNQLLVKIETNEGIYLSPKKGRIGVGCACSETETQSVNEGV